MIKTIMKTVRTSATTMPMTKPLASLGAVSGAPVSARPPRTTLLHTSAITKPNAAPRELAIVFRTSDIESCFSSAMRTPDPATSAYPIKGLCFAMKISMRGRRAFSARRGLQTAIRPARTLCGTNRGDDPRHRLGAVRRPGGRLAHPDHAVLRRRRTRVVETREPPATRGVQDPRRVEPDFALDGGRPGAWHQHDQFRKPWPCGRLGGPTARPVLHGPRPGRGCGPKGRGDPRAGSGRLPDLPHGPDRRPRERDLEVVALLLHPPVRASGHDRGTGDDRLGDCRGSPGGPDRARTGGWRRARRRDRDRGERTRAPRSGVRGPSGRRRTAAGGVADPPSPSHRSAA